MQNYLCAPVGCNGMIDLFTCSCVTPAYDFGLLSGLNGGGGDLLSQADRFIAIRFLLGYISCT